MLQDLRYAFRTFRRSPLVGLAAVLTLGLGIGAATAVFSVVDAAILRPLPFEAPDRLVRVWELTRDGDRFPFSGPDYVDVRAGTRALAGVAAYSDLGSTSVLAGAGDPERITAVPITASLPDVLGVAPIAGRMFGENEERSAGPRALVLSHGLWARRFGSDAGALGQRVTLDGAPAVVAAVMPPGFDFPGGADAWVPLRLDRLSDRGDHELAVIGRLAPGATLPQLRDELRAMMGRMADAHPEIHAGWSADAVSFSDWIVAPRFREAVWVLFGAVGALLLLACANVASLLLAQAAARRGEMRVRTALGAGRGRLVRQLLTESAVLAAFGTAAAVLIAIWSVEAVRVLAADRLPRLEDVRVGWSVLAFACGAGILSCLAFGLAPALHAARIDVRSGMDEGLRYSAGNRRLRHGLVVVEVTLAAMLLAGAGLLANSFVRLTRVDAGFDARNAVAIPVELPGGPSDQASAFYAELLERVRALPGVADAGATSTNPFRQGGFSNDVTPAERAAEAPPSGLVQAGWRSVTPGYFEAMRVPVLSGRTFRSSDDASAERVVVVSASLERRLWPDGSAVGKRIYWGGTTGRTRTVIGVSGDIRDVRLEAEPPPMLFVPHAQVPVPAMTIVVRTSLDPAAVAPGLREAARALNPSRPPPPVHEISASRGEAVAGPRFNLALTGAFALIALVLAVTGVYAMLAFTVWERRREIAVRLALGASRGGIARLVLRTGLALAASGVAIGTAAALGGARVLSSLLFGIEPTDPLTFAGAALALLGAAALASWLPARRAAGVDPSVVLRE